MQVDRSSNSVDNGAELKVVIEAAYRKLWHPYGRRYHLMNNNGGLVRQFIEEVLNRGQMDATGDYFWEDMVEQVPFPGQGPGLQGLKDVLQAMRAAFPDMHWTVVEQLTEGDRVLTRFEWTGTHRGPFLGVPATGRAVKVWGMVIDRFMDGKIKDTRILMDTLGLMIQLGVVAPPGG
jgi:steroid delta-isomerase-like uncharacterized protein